MGNSTEGEIVWHGETITAPVQETLRVLRDRSLLGSAYLAGGTGLALQFGHRRSLDLDFFLNEVLDEEAFLQRAQTMPGFSLVSKAPHTIHANIQDTKVSFLEYLYPLLFPCVRFLGVPVADPRDIACMKISAIASRGTKRDFVDLYFAGQRFDFSDLLVWFARKYAQTRYNRLHVLKSLTYFEDAEKDPMPHMLVPLEWAEVKAFFRQAAAGRV